MKRFAALALLLLAACRDEEVTRARVAKDEDGAAPAAEVPAARPRGLRWTLPAGWKEAAGGGMRLATFTPPGGLKAEATVVALPGDSGGELANVNRWRAQIALPATDGAGLAAARTRIDAKAGPVTAYDFTGGGPKPSRLIAAVISRGGTAWFFKLTGDAAAVEAARGGFTAILKGLTADAPR